MANTSSRTLRLLSLLQTHRHWRGSDLAERLGASERTLRRDVERLRELGYPVEAQRGVDGGYQLSPGAALPPLVLEDDEAVALVVGLQSALQSGSVLGIDESSVRALTKIVQVMPPRLRYQVDAVASMTVPAAWNESNTGVDSGTLVAVAQACRDSERLHFVYAAPDATPLSRRVEPYRLVLLGRRWYLVAWDLDRSDWRSFRLDRLSEPQNHKAQFVPRAKPFDDAADFVRAGIDRLQRPYEIEVLVLAPASIVRSQLGPWAIVDELDARKCRVRMTADAFAWPIVALLGLGVDFELVSPAEMIEFAAICARRLQLASSPADDRSA